MLTHGHLPENNNHGGKKTTLTDPRTDASGAPTSAVDISNFLYGVERSHRPQADPDRRAGSVDHVRQPRRTRPERVALDHRVQGAVHRVDRRRVPARRWQHLVRLRPARQRGRAHGRDATRGPRPPICQPARTPTSAASTPSCAAPSASSPWVDAPTANRRRQTGIEPSADAGSLRSRDSVRGWTTSGQLVSG